MEPGTRSVEGPWQEVWSTHTPCRSRGLGRVFTLQQGWVAGAGPMFLFFLPLILRLLKHLMTMLRASLPHVSLFPKLYERGRGGASILYPGTLRFFPRVEHPRICLLYGDRNVGADGSFVPILTFPPLPKAFGSFSGDLHGCGQRLP